MIIHPRESIVKEASIDLDTFLIQWNKKHELTYGELFTLLGELVLRMAKYAVRAERRSDEQHDDT